MAGNPVSRVGDISLGSCGKPAIPALSSNARAVFVNGRPVMNVGSVWGTHCTDDCHTGIAITGNPTVLVSGSPIVTIGKVELHGDIPGQGSPNVYA